MKKFSRWGTRGAVAAALSLAGVFIFLVYKGESSLRNLTEPSADKATLVYARWTELDPAHPVSWDYLQENLRMLGYQKTSQKVPDKPMQFSGEYPDLYLFTSRFQYPDKDLPAQRLHLRFTRQRLSEIETLSPTTALPSWRLEPKVLAQWSGNEDRTRPKTKLTDLPPYTAQAVIAMEDKRFYKHGAIDFVGILRALWVDLRDGRWAQGGSTLSQQLARSVFLTIDRSLTRKFFEAGLAFYLELRFSKPQLLEMYLNRVYWGSTGQQSLIGIEQASQSYFGKSASRLTLSESALLAGLLQSPNRFSPRVHRAVALERRALVLQLMQQQKFITETQHKRALAEPLQVAPLQESTQESGYFLASLQDALEQKYALPVILKEGWKIYTTLDPILQHHAVQAVRPTAGQAALVAIDPRTGETLAWVGGTRYVTAPFDRAIHAKRQPGSAFKPFVMLAALDSHKATVATMLDDKPFSMTTPSGPWAPKNYDRTFRGRVSVWDSLVYSINIPTVHLALMTGLPVVVDYAQRCGITSPLEAAAGLALGISEVSVFEMTDAYGVLANGGIRNPAFTLQVIVDGQGKLVDDHLPKPIQVASPEAVSLVTQMLEAVLKEGTAKQSKAYGFTHIAAGKTGTSEDYKDAWFIGYTPRLVCGVWVGYDQPKSLGRAAAGIALPIWVQFMTPALSLWPDEEFPKVRSLVWRSVDSETGFLARSGCSHTEKRAFMDGTLPPDCPDHKGGLLGYFSRWGTRKSTAAKKTAE